MNRQAWVSFSLAGVSLTHFGLVIPSPFASLEMSNSEVSSFSSWTLRCVIGGDANKNVNVASLEALLYSAAQAADASGDSSGVPVSFAFGWLNAKGEVDDYVSYQGFTLQFQVSTSGIYMVYTINGYASLAVQNATPVLNIPELCGIVQPSAVVEALADATKATYYYDLDIDHNDAPTLISHGPLTTSFNSYVRGSYSTEDDYESFPGLLRLSKSYSSGKEGSGLAITDSIKSLSQVMNNISISPLDNFLKKSISDDSVQCSSFSFWIDEPTMTKPGVIHYKSDSNLLGSHMKDTLEYGTANTNVLSIQGSYNGVAYSMSNMKFTSVGFDLDVSGNQIIQDAKVVNSWSASLGDVYQSANIINDVQALASQFSGNFTVTIPGSTKVYSVAEPVSLLVVSQGTISPITGIYNIVSVSHAVSNTFVTTLKLQRLTMSTANQVASGQGILVTGSQGYPNNAYNNTSNVISPYKVNFGTIYPNYTHMGNRSIF